MAPYGGPSLLEVVKLLAKGQLPYALGSGLPQATFQHGPDGVLELRGLSGGEGFGVQADLVNPFVDAGPLVRGTWQQVVAWLCEHWDYGPPWGHASKERLKVRFADKELTALSLAEAAAACREAHRSRAPIDFEVVR